MGKKIDNESVSADRIVIERDDAAELMKTVRWGAAEHLPTENATVEVSQNAALSQSAAELCAVPKVERMDIDVARLVEITSDDIIDRFLRSDNLRIVADEGEDAEPIRTEAVLSDEDDIVSEELAEIYLAQGLKDMAKETYRKLSLLNPEKSIYFAEIIAKIDSNN